MTTIFKAAVAGAACALAVCATAAQAGELYSAYSYENGENGLIGYDPGSLAEHPAHTVAPEVRGLVFGACCDAALNGGVYFVSRQTGLGASVSRYDLGGFELDTVNFGPTLDAGVLAFGGDTLFMAYETVFGGSGYHVAWLDPDFGPGPIDIDIGGKATGMAFGGDSLFVAWDSTIARYDLSGNLLGSHDFGAVDLGPLAYGAGQLFASYVTGGSNYGFASIDPLTFLAAGANVAATSEVKALTFGEGSVYAAFDHRISRYGLDGVEQASIDTGRRINEQLTFYTAPGGVPEPSAWVLMILGFGAAGAALRARRRAAAAVA